MRRVKTSFILAAVTDAVVTNQSSGASSAPAPLRSTKTVVNENHSYYSIAVDYPQFIAPGDADVAAVNRVIKTDVLKHLSDMRGPLRKIKSTAPGAKDGIYDFSCGSNIVLAQPNLISVTADCEESLDTMPHPSHYTLAWSYQLHPLQKLTLPVLFQPNSGYLQKIAAFCRADLKNQLKEQGAEAAQDIDQNVTASADNFNKLAIHKEGIEFFFDQGAVLDYVVGGQSVVVPWRVLGPLLAPNTGVAKLAR